MHLGIRGGASHCFSRTGRELGFLELIYNSSFPLFWAAEEHLVFLSRPLVREGWFGGGRRSVMTCTLSLFV
jgi:hypothetical protein